MNTTQAEQLTVGDRVTFRGKQHRVTSRKRIPIIRRWLNAGTGELTLTITATGNGSRNLVWLPMAETETI